MMENFKLKVFRVVADTLNFRRAADELHITQTAITAQTKALEESLGIALFDRLGRNIKLTPAGNTLLHYVRQIEALTNDALAALAFFGGQEGGELNVGASHTVFQASVSRVDDKTFDGWVREHHRLLFGLAYWWTGSRSDAEELTQEAFFQAYRSRHTLQDAKATKAWLVGILRHTFLHMLRKRRNSHEAPLEDADQLPGTDRSLNPDVLALHKAIQQLDERYQLPVVLFYFRDLSYKEIAEALDLPMGTVMSRLSRGRQLLHATLQSSQRLYT